MALNIVFVTQSSPVYMAEFFSNLFQLLDKDLTIKGAVFFKPYSSQGKGYELQARFRYYGIIAFLQMCLYLLYNKVRCYLPGSDRFSVHQCLKQHGIAEASFLNVNSPEFIAYLRQNAIDILVSVACPQILKQEVITAPKMFCLNYHTALLPENRGRQPLFWALYKNQKETGITIHKIDTGIDTGDILTQESFAISDADTLHTLYKKSIVIGPRVLAQALKKCSHGNAVFRQNPASTGSYNRFPDEKDSRLFRQNGKRFF
jgi:methionyl-tRNA formyltransferase